METNHMLRHIKRLYIMAEQYHQNDWLLTPSQSLFMEYLYEQPENISCSTKLCGQSGFSKAALSRMLKNLRKQGYLEMPHDPKDDRKKEIILTSKALMQKEAIIGALSQRQDCMCRGISEKNLLILGDCLQVMIRNLEQENKGVIDYEDVKNIVETAERV